MLSTDQPVPAALAAAVVVYEHGARKKLDSFWASQPCLLLFLRHLACPGCWSQVDQLTPQLAELKRLGVRVVLVGLAEPSRLLSFRERARLEDVDVELVTDPTLTCHREAGLLRSAWSTYGPVAVAHGLRLYAAGYFVRRHEGDGDLTQQGGALLVDAGGRVVLHHVAEHLADFVDLAEVRQVAASLGAVRAPARI